MENTETAWDHLGLVDNFIYSCKLPINLIHEKCPRSGKILNRFSENNYGVAAELFKSTHEYDGFCRLFTYASQKLASIEIRGDALVQVPSHVLSLEYEAYDRITDPARADKFEGNLDMRAYFESEIESNVKVSGFNFAIDITHDIASLAMGVFETNFGKRFTLPSHWSFLNFTIDEYKSVYIVITSLAYTHLHARFVAVNKGCRALGNANCHYMPSKADLKARIHRYTGLRRETIESVLSIMTYKKGKIKSPDPAYQPLFEINETQYLISPSLWINTSLERNLSVLINRIPEEKSLYLSLVDQKEGVMKDRIKSKLKKRKFRFWDGKLTHKREIPPLDLVIIDDSKKICFVLELKWFIAPAEPREIFERLEEVEKGINQLRLVRAWIQDNQEELKTKLSLRSEFQISYVMLSANSVCDKRDVDPELNLLNEAHFTRMLEVEDSDKVFKIIESKSYLPIEGVHFNKVDLTYQVGRWQSPWYGIRVIKSVEYVPEESFL
jgi:hypothetical protein